MKTIYVPEGRAHEFSELALNLYTTCNISCSYCFNKKMPWYKEKPCQPRTDVLKALELKAKQMAGDKRDILMCFTCDPYPVLHSSKLITREALLILEAYGLSAQILTKAGKRSTVDADILKRNNWKYGCSMTCSSEETRLEYEPFSAPYLERKEALTTMKTIGIYTWVSLEPVLDPKQTLWIIENLLLRADTTPDFWKLGRWNYDQEANKIDWVDYYNKATAVLDSNNQKYMVKSDLLKSVYGK